MAYSFLPGKSDGLFTVKPKQITETSLTFVNVFLTFMSFLNRVERSKEKSFETGRGLLQSKFKIGNAFQKLFIVRLYILTYIF